LGGRLCPVQLVENAAESAGEQSLVRRFDATAFHRSPVARDRRVSADVFGKLRVSPGPLDDLLGSGTFICLVKGEEHFVSGGGRGVRVHILSPIVCFKSS